MRTLINNTSYASSVDAERAARSTLKFLLNNVNNVELDKNDQDIVKDLRFMADVPVQTIFRNLVQEGPLKDDFLLMDFSDQKESPELLSYDEISVDGAWLKNAPDHLKRIWINLTPALGRRQRSTHQMVISNSFRVMGYLVRGMFCRNYGLSEMWVSPTHVGFIIESFSAAVSLRLRQAYNLDPMQALFVQTAFAYHYSKLLGPEEELEEFPILLNRCGFLGSFSDVKLRIEQLDDALGDEDLYNTGLESVCRAVSLVGPERMRRFDQSALFRLMAIGNQNNMSMALSLDYPPYWVFLLLEHVSGTKNATMSLLFRSLSGLERKLRPWAEQLASSRNIYSRERKR